MTESNNHLVSQLQTENNHLKKLLSERDDEIHRLKKQNDFFRQHETLVKGNRGEILIAQLLNGTVTAKHIAHDVTIDHSGILIEVKFASLSPKNSSARTKRWLWSKLLGESGKKKYDNLILIGDQDERFADNYLDPSSPFVLFDIPFNELNRVTLQTGVDDYIQFTSNPTGRLGPKAKRMFENYQVTTDELKQKYGI